jgi:hypothetical protein
MAYSSFVDASVTIGNYDRLRIGLKYKPETEIYLLNIRTPESNLPKMPQNVDIVDMGRTIDIILSGNETESKRLAQLLYDQLGRNVGIARYNRGQKTQRNHRNAGIARAFAEQDKIPYRVYDENEDSPEALFGNTK